jgi:hypothetical protein
VAVELSPKSRSDLKRKIAELNRVRTQMKLDIMKMRREPGPDTLEEFADTDNSLVLLEEELRELVRQYEDGMSPQDSRD